MTALLRPRATRFRPASPRVEWTHPLSRGLVLCAISGEAAPLDLVTGKRFTASVQKYGPTAIGPASLFDGTSGTTASIPLDLSGTNKVSVSAWLYWDAYANDDLFAWEHSSNFNTSPGGFIFDPNSSSPSGVMFAATSASGPVYNSCSATRPTAGLHHFVVTYDRTVGAGGTRVYVDSVEVSASFPHVTTLGGNFLNSTLFLMSRASTSIFGKGRLPLLSVYNRMLSFEEIQALFVEPYAPIRRSAPASRFLVAAPPVSTVTVGSSLVLQWNTRAAVGSQRQALWSVRAAVGSSRQVLWAVRAAVGASRQLIWSVTTAVGAARGLVWAVRSAVGSQRDVRWSTAAATGSARALSWNTRAAVGSSRELDWRITVAVGSARSLTWSVRAAVGRDGVLRWSTAAPVGQSVTLRWNTRTTVGSARNVRWSIADRVGSQLALLWAVAAPAGRDAVLRWHTRAVVGRQVTLFWRVRIGQDRDITFIVSLPYREWAAAVRDHEWTGAEPYREWASSAPQH